MSLFFWIPPDHWDADDIAFEMTDAPNIWTDGSRGISLLLVGLRLLALVFICPASEIAFEGSVWGVAEEYGDVRLERRRAFMPVPGVLQTVQRAEFWCAILAVQAYWPCHSGVDNLNVARSFGRLLDHATDVDVGRFSGCTVWECTFPPLLHVQELPEFSTLIAFDKSKWPRCLLWHGWLPGLSCGGHREPWAASFGQLA